MLRFSRKIWGSDAKRGVIHEPTLNKQTHRQVRAVILGMPAHHNDQAHFDSKGPWTTWVCAHIHRIYVYVCNYVSAYIYICGRVYIYIYICILIEI